jgi:hypothetical protein
VVTSVSGTSKPSERIVMAWNGLELLEAMAAGRLTTRAGARSAQDHSASSTAAACRQAALAGPARRTLGSWQEL